MPRLLSIFLALLTCVLSCTPHAKHADKGKNIYRDTSDHDNHNVRIKIANEWIEKIRRFDYSRNTKDLLQEFESFLKPGTIENPHRKHIDEGYGRVLDPIFVDLDGEPGEELICLLGWDVGSPYLGVFKQIDSEWYLLYLEDIWMFNEGTELSVANNFSKNKVFYCRHLYARGTCTYNDGYTFYKLINNKVYPCLKLINDVNSCGWSPYPNQDVRTSFNFSGDDVDEVGVNYVYNFFYTPQYQREAPEQPDNPVIKGEDYVRYIWDAKTFTYKLNIPSFKKGTDDLTAEKIAYFGRFDNALFVKAFRQQIDEALKNGTPQQKKALKEICVNANDSRHIN
nr:hypothetical protein [uncultured Mucilaginibacter sp.]